jgi:hypothetical protein
MFKTVGARYALRSVLVGIGSFCSSVLADADWRRSALTAVLAALAYAGIGAVVPAVEPSIGKKLGP